MSNFKNKTEISPKGIFKYPRLNRPDTKFNDAGLYQVKLVVTPEEAQPLVDTIDKAIDAQVEKVKASGEVKGRVKRADPPYVVDEKSGDVVFNFKMKATGTRQDGTTFTQKPGLKTASLKDIPVEKIIGGGSEGKVSFSMAPFYTSLVGAGVSLRLKAVQVFKLVEPSYSYGFEAEEGCEEPDFEDAEQGSSESDSAEDAGDAQDF